MNILIACEESQALVKEFKKLGCNVFSCDIVYCSGGYPENHIMQDVIPLLNGDCSFYTCDGVLHEIKGKWDLIIAFPPCFFNEFLQKCRYSITCTSVTCDSK